ncbi:unnamed protein product [Dimorphilus gyrociliatus]|uniref:Major facilitator superfamily (MFS) profile domain-containing protein n=1 Tax=Dimorphilus gyrociliatus TaxID=2664684 RepID=A0A7I8VSB0_9ANNE|nr:unnamed protein product [Dimorphilus gyrociliatus]
MDEGEEPLLQSESGIKYRANNSRFVYVLAFFSTIGGFLFGYDTGVVSGAMILLADVFKLHHVWQELIISVTVGAAAIFAMIGGVINEKFGRKRTILVASFVFTLGSLLLGVSFNKEMLLIGRIIVGIGIGLASMTVPMYIAECSPSNLRGYLVTLNNGAITFGQLAASIIDGLFSSVKPNGWRYMLGLAAIPAIIQFIGFFFLPESPRWLFARNRDDEAIAVLRQIRNANVDDEIHEIKTNIEEDKNVRTSRRFLLIQMLMDSTVRKALIVGCGLQLFQQLSGINTVMYYSATIIKMSGVEDEKKAIWLAAVTAAVNFLFTLVGIYLVEKIGRRLLTISSLVGVTFSLAFLGIGFQLSSIHSATVNNPIPDTHCSMYTSCTKCISAENCGYCYNSTFSTCLPYIKNSTSNLCQSKIGDTFKFNEDFCPTKYSWIALVGMIVYLIFFAPGMGPMPWTINAEIYPLWARSTGNAVATSVNWISNLIISMTFLSLTDAITKYGAFYLYTSFALIAIIFVSLFVPETKGKSLEEIQNVFKKSWTPCGSRRVNE